MQSDSFLVWDTSIGRDRRLSSGADSSPFHQGLREPIARVGQTHRPRSEQLADMTKHTRRRTSIIGMTLVGFICPAVCSGAESAINPPNTGMADPVALINAFDGYKSTAHTTNPGFKYRATGPGANAPGSCVASAVRRVNRKVLQHEPIGSKNRPGGQGSARRGRGLSMAYAFDASRSLVIWPWPTRCFFSARSDNVRDAKK